jgi:hypothetical protein
METIEALDAAAAALRSIDTAFSSATGDDVVALAERVEVVGRLVDGLRTRAAGELEGRAEGHERLAVTHGARDAAELLVVTARLSHREARRRIALGTALQPTANLQGVEVPGRYPEVAEALTAGRIGVDAARVIINTVKEIRPRVSADGIDRMVADLVRLAEQADAEAVAEAAVRWSLLLDPDGAEPRDRARRRKRAFVLGRMLADGTTSFRGVALPEHIAMLKELFQSRRRGGCLIRTAPGGDADPETEGAEWREGADPNGADGRSRAQQDYDALMDAVQAGVAAEDSGAVAAQVTHETIVTVTAAEVQARDGQGWAPGVLADLPLPTIEQQVCTGGIRLLVVGPKGEPLQLSQSQRLFTNAQKKTLVIRAGGRCQYPGCRVPAGYLQAHHVDWWSRDAGPTDVSNGLMLCSFHHHLIHSPDNPIRIVRHEGDLYFVSHDWGPPRREQRAQTGPPHRAAA